MIKKAVIVFSLLILIGCSTSQKATKTELLFDILTLQEDGGASIRFFEILTEEKEIKMLQNDALLKNKISSQDLKTSNFVILNMGEKNTLGYTIGIQSVKETPDKIIIKVRDIEPKSPQSQENDVYYYPYSILKVNSKKEISIQ
jgi:hypothetical protein